VTSNPPPKISNDLARSASNSFSAPTASATSALPDRTLWQASQKAVEALAQAFSTLTIGTPLMPRSRSTTWPATMCCP
jgi:hypothetical protein